MSLNVEIKARASDLDSLEQLLRQITSQEPILVEQHDTFYRVPKGRLKVRCNQSGECQIIYYHREKEQKGPMMSRYFAKPLNAPAETMEELQQRFGASRVVDKLRKLFLVDDARIHLDLVAGLGQFIEIEVACPGMRHKNEAIQKAKRLMSLLGIKGTDLLWNSYEDMQRNLAR